MSVRTSAAVWDRSQHCGSNLLMLLAIADFADDDGNAYPSVTTLAAKCRMKPRNANYVLKALQDSGELAIRIGEGPRGTNRYRIKLASLGVQQVAGVQGIAGVQPIAPTPAIQRTKPLQPVADKPSLNRHEPPDMSKSAPKPPRLACPIDQIKAAYADVLSELPAIKVWSTKRQSTLKARWAQMAKDKAWASTEDGAAWFLKFFETVAASDFLMGRGERKSGHEGWRCDFDFLMSTKGFIGVIEGKYANREAA